MWWRWYEKRRGGTRLDWIHTRNQSITPKWLKQLQRDLDQLLELRPLAYVLDEAWFLNRKYVLRGAVLIPRPETEELVQWVLERESHSVGLRVLDAGCGSGAIACSLGLERPRWKVSGMDIDPAALSVARQNVRRLKAPVRIYRADLHGGRWPAWDVLVCNPPYIGQGMDHTLSPGVAQYEPLVALLAPQADPLYYYLIIANQLRRTLSDSGQPSGGTGSRHNLTVLGDADRKSTNDSRISKVLYLEMPEGCAHSIQSQFQEWPTEVRADAQGIERMLRVEGVR